MKKNVKQHFTPLALYVLASARVSLPAIVFSVHDVNDVREEGAAATGCSKVRLEGPDGAITVKLKWDASDEYALPTLHFAEEGKPPWLKPLRKTLRKFLDFDARSGAADAHAYFLSNRLVR